MIMTQEVLPGGILKVKLAGSLDIAGAGEIDMRFAVIGGSSDRVCVDFSAVEFLASIGIRVLVKAARAIGHRGGRMVLVNPRENCRRVLSSTGVDTIITIVDDEAAAMAIFA